MSSMFNASSQFIINGGNFTQSIGNDAAFKLLIQNVATLARHDAGGYADPAKCHPDTRLAILTDLEEWVSSEMYSCPIRWMSGSAGVGKTAIMRTTAETLKRRKLLLADFFFWRTGDRCNNAEFLIATLAYQISISIPDTRPYIGRAIEQDPHIFAQNLEAQILAMIVDPLTELLHAKRLPSNYPRVFMVDGLDECLKARKQSQDVEKQVEVLQVLHRMLNLLPAPFYLLVASRPENHIQDMFDTVLNDSSSQTMLNISHDADDDIRTFYVNKFREIREHHPLRSCLPLSEWPSQNTLDELVSRASGQFIYASTVVKFVGAGKKNPLNQLNAILDVKVRGNTRPFEAVDILYSTIFLSIEEEDLPFTLRVLGILLIGRSEKELSFPSSFWDHFIGLQQGEVQRLMLGLESVVNVKGPNGQSFHFYHASLQDFLFDSSRSGLFHIDNSLTFAALAVQAIHHLSTTDDDSILYYIIRGMSHWFGSANPSIELSNAIDQERISTSPWALKLSYPMFLSAIEESSLPRMQKIDLYSKQLNAYHAQLKLTLSIYLVEERLIFLLLSSVHSFRSRNMVDDLINEVCSFPPELALIDNDHGFHFIGDKVSRDIAESPSLDGFPRFAQAVVDVLTRMPDSGDLYAKAASFLVMSLSYRQRYIHVNIEFESYRLLETFLSLASAQEDLSSSLKDNFLFHNRYIPRNLQTAVQRYISRVEEVPSAPQKQVPRQGLISKILSLKKSRHSGKVGVQKKRDS